MPPPTNRNNFYPHTLNVSRLDEIWLRTREFSSKRFLVAPSIAGPIKQLLWISLTSANNEQTEETYKIIKSLS